MVTYRRLVRRRGLPLSPLGFCGDASENGLPHVPGSSSPFSALVHKPGAARAAAAAAAFGGAGQRRHRTEGPGSLSPGSQEMAISCPLRLAGVSEAGIRQVTVTVNGHGDSGRRSGAAPARTSPSMSRPEIGLGPAGRARSMPGFATAASTGAWSFTLRRGWGGVGGKEGGKGVRREGGWEEGRMGRREGRRDGGREGGR